MKMKNRAQKSVGIIFQYLIKERRNVCFFEVNLYERGLGIAEMFSYKDFSTGDQHGMLLNPAPGWGNSNRGFVLILKMLVHASVYLISGFQSENKTWGCDGHDITGVMVLHKFMHNRVEFLLLYSQK